MTAKHTPGPWSIEAGHEGESWYIHDSIGEDVARIQAGPHVDANARLIAEAPAMAALLPKVIEVLDAFGIVYGASEVEPLDVLAEARTMLARIDEGDLPCDFCREG